MFGGVGIRPPVLAPPRKVPPPPPPTIAGTLSNVYAGYASGGGSGAQQAAASAVGSLVGGPVGGILGNILGGIDFGFGTSSKANWDRTWGRVWRAAVLGYVPSLEGVEEILRRLQAIWQASGDGSGAKFWDRVVSYFAIPTEPGGTKEGFNSGAPLGSKRAEKTPGFAAGLSRLLAAVGG